MKVQLGKFSGPRFGDRKGLAILGELEPNHDGDTARVHLAALKLAGGDIDRLITQIAAATRDWRDVVSAAEYPAYLRERTPSELSKEQRQWIVESDWNQYQEWLGK